MDQKVIFFTSTLRTADFSTAPYPASSAGTLEKTVICQRHHQEDVHCSVYRHSHHRNIINHHDLL